MNHQIEKVLFSESEIASMVQKLGQAISCDYHNKRLILVSLMKGSLIFTADLMRQITLPCQLECMTVSSYKGVQSSGKITVVQDVSASLEHADVLVVEDMLDTGLTLQYILGHLKQKHAESVRICTLFDKPEGRKASVKADYVGAKVPNAFLVGYGLDYNEYYRNLPYVGILSSAVIDRDCQQNSSQSKE